MKNNLNYLTQVEISQLSENGKSIINVARRQSEHLEKVMQPQNGYFFVHIGSELLYQNEDTLRIILISKLSFRERCLVFGVRHLEAAEISHMGEYGFPIPNEEYISRMERLLGVSKNTPLTKSFVISDVLLKKYQKGQIYVEELINQYAEDVLDYCSTWQYDFR